METPTTLPQAQCEFRADSDGGLTIRVGGDLTNATVGELWTRAEKEIAERHPNHLIIEADDLRMLDGAGMGWLLKIQCEASNVGRRIEVRGLNPAYRRLLARFKICDYQSVKPTKPRAERLPAHVGRVTAKLWSDFIHQIAYVGELGEGLFRAVMRPGSIRWRDLLLSAERTGADAVPIVSLICGLVGLVLAFQSAMAMRPYGAEIYVANLVTIAMLRELGPLMTAIILSGRSGAAYAAEIGTMKVNDEVSALKTMGLNPVPFLAVPRVLGMVLTIPFLTILGNVMGILGGAVMFLSLEYPLSAYFKQVVSSAELRHLLSGLVKSVAFGLTVAGVGCMRGLQTARGPSAVGLSATSAVVTAILLIVVIDAVMGTVFYYLEF